MRCITIVLSVLLAAELSGAQNVSSSPKSQTSAQCKSFLCGLSQDLDKPMTDPLPLSESTVQIIRYS